jgi:hypothetical protein
VGILASVAAPLVGLAQRERVFVRHALGMREDGCSTLVAIPPPLRRPALARDPADPLAQPLAQMRQSGHGTAVGRRQLVV